MSEKSLTAGSTLARLLKGCKAHTEGYVSKCPEDRRCRRLAEGKSTPIWLLGHMANTVEFLGNYIGLKDPSGAIPGPWRALFTPAEFGGKPISANPADYPAWEEVAAAYAKVLDHFADRVAALTDEQLLAPPAGEVPPPLKSRIKTVQDCVTLQIIHDSHHRGQLAQLMNAPD